jgi:hypothetical protein
VLPNRNISGKTNWQWNTDSNWTNINWSAQLKNCQMYQWWAGENWHQ